MVVEQVL